MNNNIALFDLDGTLCDYDKVIIKDLNYLKSPGEKDIRVFNDRVPEYIKRRANMIRSSKEWWSNLPIIESGMQILRFARNILEMRIMILTAGPKKNPAAWAGKKEWIDKNLGEDTEVTITRDKGLVYGKILVDDFPKYVESWLEWRKRGLVIMPANHLNKNFHHKQVIRYNKSCNGDEGNYYEVANAMAQHLGRKPYYTKITGEWRVSR